MLESLLIPTAIVALAEIGDKTQLLALLLAARFRQPWPIIWGIVVATLANHFAAGALGNWVASLFSAVVVCHLLSQGSFYWLSDSVLEPTFDGWWKNYTDWFLPYLRTTAIYVGLAVIVHVGVLQASRLQAWAKSSR